MSELSLILVAANPRLQVDSLENTLSWAGHESDESSKSHLSELHGARFDFQRNLLSSERSSHANRSHLLFGSTRELLGPR